MNFIVHTLFHSKLRYSQVPLTWQQQQHRHNCKTILMSIFRNQVWPRDNWAFCSVYKVLLSVTNHLLTSVVWGIMKCYSNQFVISHIFGWPVRVLYISLHSNDNSPMWVTTLRQRHIAARCVTANITFRNPVSSEVLVLFELPGRSCTGINAICR